MSQTNRATEPATFQPAIRAVANSDGRLIAGPANSNATAAPAGNRAESKLKASGISRNVGRASGTASVPTNSIANVRDVPPANAPAGNHLTRIIETTSPRMRAGTVRTRTLYSACPKDSLGAPL